MKSAKLIPLLLALLPLPVLADVPDEPVFSQAQLDQMLAPIALYPDVLLAQVLMAATYPLEVVEAARWSRAHPDLEGEVAVEAVEDEDWDMSVKSLVAFPDLIQLMDDNLSWTRRLGDAFLLQQADVMDATQKLRQKALETGSLDSLAHLRVERQEQVIVIEPADVRVIYVPYYSSRVVYGDWWWYGYPPYYWAPPRAYYSSVGFYWSHGFHLSAGFYWSSCDWHRRSVVVVERPRTYHRPDHRTSGPYRRFDPDTDRWRHDPRHRRGVTYGSDELARDYGRSSASGITRARMPDPDREHRRDATAPSRDPRARPDRTAGSEPATRPERIAREDSGNPAPRPERIAGVNRRPQDSDRVAPPSRNVATIGRPERAERTDRPSAVTRPAPQVSGRPQPAQTRPQPAVSGRPQPAQTHPQPAVTGRPQPAQTLPAANARPAPAPARVSPAPAQPAPGRVESSTSSTWKAPATPTARVSDNRATSERPSRGPDRRDVR